MGVNDARTNLQSLKKVKTKKGTRKLSFSSSLRLNLTTEPSNLLCVFSFTVRTIPFYPGYVSTFLAISHNPNVAKSSSIQARSFGLKVEVEVEVVQFVRFCYACNFSPRIWFQK